MHAPSLECKKLVKQQGKETKVGFEFQKQKYVCKQRSFQSSIGETQHETISEVNSHFKCLKECVSTSTVSIFKKKLVLLHLYPLPLCFESSRGVVGMMGLLFKPPHLHFPGRFFFVVASTMKFHGSYHLLVFSNLKWYTLYTFLQNSSHYFWNYILFVNMQLTIMDLFQYAVLIINVSHQSLCLH